MPIIKTISDPEIDLLLNYLSTPSKAMRSKQIPHRNYLIAVLMLDAGLRVGEVVALKISQLIQNNEPTPFIHITSVISKTNRDRNIPTTERIRSAINNHVKWSTCDAINSPDNWVFPGTPPTKYINVRQIRFIIKFASLATIGRSISPHVLRHTFATRLLRYSSTSIVQQLLGHASLSSTQVYLHPNSQDLTKAVNQL